MRIRIGHAIYDDGGGCGHWIEVDGQMLLDFNFSHPDGNEPAAKRTYGEKLVREKLGKRYVPHIDWEWSEQHVLDD